MPKSGYTKLELPNEMSGWNKYSEPNGFVSISYNPKSYLNEVTVRGVDGWEILGVSVPVKANTSYIVSFNYVVPNYGTTITYVDGLVVGASSTQPSGEFLGDLGHAILPSSKSNGKISFTFNSGNRTKVYIFFNFGYVKDENTYTFKLSNAFTTWEDNAATSYESGNGSASNPYIIKTAEQLAFLAVQCNSSTLSGKYYSLGASIDLSGMLWNPIGNNKYNFGGVFNGQNYTISGMNIFDAVSPCVGLFSVLENGVVKNLILSSGTIYLSSDGGSIAGKVLGSNTLVENCIISNINFINLIQDRGAYYGSIGGIVAVNNGKIQNCIVRNINIDADLSHSSSGLVSYNNGTIKNCAIFNSTIKGGFENRSDIVDRPLSGGYINSCYSKNVLVIYSGNLQAKNRMVGDSSAWGDFVSLNGLNSGYPIPKSLTILGNATSQTSRDIYNILINLGIK